MPNTIRTTSCVWFIALALLATTQCNCKLTNHTAQDIWTCLVLPPGGGGYIECNARTFQLLVYQSKANPKMLPRIVFVELRNKDGELLMNSNGTLQAGAVWVSMEGPTQTLTGLVDRVCRQSGYEYSIEEDRLLLAPVIHAARLTVTTAGGTTASMLKSVKSEGAVCFDIGIEAQLREAMKKDIRSRGIVIDAPDGIPYRIVIEGMYGSELSLYEVLSIVSRVVPVNVTVSDNHVELHGN